MSDVLVLNAGSSTIKYRLLDESGAAVAGGLVERIGETGSRLVHRSGGDERVVEERIDDHAAGYRLLFAELGHPEDQLLAVGHRIVHGGARFTEATLVDDGVLAALEELTPLAPLHNPAGISGIHVAREHYPGVPQVAVFDTAFHHTMPARAHRYALPRELADRYGIRRYGFHGISHAYVARRAAEHLRRPLTDLAMVSLHLGNGASAAAVSGGRSVDTSMGLTPLNGLVMGTRAGDADPGVVFHLHREAGLPAEQIEDLLTRRSGLLGLAGASDLREVHRRADAGDRAAAEALELYCYRIRCHVGAYAAALGGLDALVFTAGVGEHDPAVRAEVCRGLAHLGIAVDPHRNTADESGPRTISPPDAAVAVLVVPTDEESEVAHEARALVATRPADRSTA
ncbi:acetate kinase [Pseudonocardia thermophila]|jgi:acetate kinase|uniref:Acetate kinase n=1 Tax=Pseudonocardia thermophila TaxID=1848 RepID=A0A1M6UZI3_PSETH|nr:acetate kinase [Pseudonocardia thermophila]SHK74618.1 acetate kinase [Pseudonocardia thermophila]